MTTHVSKRRSRQNKLSAIHRPAVERHWLILLGLAVITFAVFAPACANEFLFWDDNLNVWKNASFNPPTLASVAGFWKGPFLDLYVPVTYTVWGILSAVAMMPTLDSRGNQLDPYIFHAANVIIHVIAVLLAFAILHRLIGKKWPAAVGALLFAIHPLQVEPVAWVTGLKDVLCGALSLAALWQYLVFAQEDFSQSNRVAHDPKIDEPSARPGRHGPAPIENDASNVPRHLWWNYAFAHVFFVLALLAKPSAVTVPAIALILDLLLIRKSLRKAIIALAPTVLLAAIDVVLSIKFQTVVAPADGGRVLLRPLIAADTLAFYLYKLVFPLWLGVQYNRSPMVVIRAGWLYFTWILPVALILTAIVFRRRAAWLLAATGIFIVAVAPVSGIVPFSFQQYATVADRYVYVAMLGPALALAAGIAILHARWSRIRRRWRPIVFTVVAILSLFAIRSFAQTFVWHDNKTLFANALAVNPKSALAYNYLAGEMALENVPGETPESRAQRLARALDLAQKAVELAPNNPDGYLTLGSIKGDAGDLNGAIVAFAKAADLGPMKADALNSYGGALAEQGRSDDQAEDLLRRAIRINPRLAKARQNLGLLLSHKRGPSDPEAIANFEQAVRLDDGDINALITLGQALMAQGNPDAFPRAEHLFRRAIQIDPHFPKAHLDLGMCLTQTRGKMDPEAFAEVQEAVRDNSADLVAQTELAKCYMDRHDRENAMQHVMIVLQKDPNNQRARHYYDILTHLRPQSP